MDAPADQPAAVEQPSELDALKQQFEQEMAKFRDATSKAEAESKAVVEKLQKENDELRAALVRSTLVPPVSQPEPVHEPTPEEIYSLRVNNGINITKQLMKERI